MEALKNTSMMLILAAVFYGAYQMFVSDPSTWQQNADANGQEQVIHQGQEFQTPDSLSALHSQTQAQNAGTQNTATQNTATQNVGTQTFGTPNTGNSGIQGQLAGNSPPIQMPPIQPPVQQPFQQQPQQNPQGQLITNINSNPAGGLNTGNAVIGGNSSADQQNAVFLSPDSSDQATGLRQVGYEGQTAADSLAANSVAKRSDLASQPNNQLGPNAVQLSQVKTEQVKAELAAQMQTAGNEIQTGKLGSALHRLSAFYDQPLEAADRKVLISWLDNLAGEVVYSTKHALTEAYQVQPGDTLGSVADRYQISPQLLANINFYGQNIADNSPLQPGSQLKVVPGPFRAVVNMKQRELTVFVGPLYAGRFNFETGDSAPERSTSNTISYVSVSGIPAQDAQQKHAALSPGNPFGKYCLVVGDEVVMHSPGNNPIGSCLQFQESDMQSLQALLTKGCHVQVIR